MRIARDAVGRSRAGQPGRELVEVGLPNEDCAGIEKPLHDGRGVFAGLPADIEVGRYHSLAAASVPDVLEVSATSEDGEIMAVRHRELPIQGVQFHPESVLTPLGSEIARNFLAA